MIAGRLPGGLQSSDVTAGPVSPTVVRAIGSRRSRWEYLADIFTLPASWPACLVHEPALRLW